MCCRGKLAAEERRDGSDAGWTEAVEGGERPGVEDAGGDVACGVRVVQIEEAPEGGTDVSETEAVSAGEQHADGWEPLHGTQVEGVVKPSSGILSPET